MKNIRGYYLIFFLITIHCFVSAQSFDKQIVNSNALHFDGIDDYVVIPHNKSLTPEKFTIECWAKSNTEYWSNHGILISKRNNYILHPVYNTKKMQVIVFVKQKCYNIEYADPDLNITDWHHYAATFNGKSLKLYIDGTLVADYMSFRELSETKNENLYIGTDTGAKDRYFDGQIDEVRIWDYARSERNILRTMYSELSGTERGLIACYNFNQGAHSGKNTADTVLLDLTGKHHGTLKNFELSGDESNWVKSTIPLRKSNYGSDLFFDLFTPLNVGIVIALLLAIFVIFLINNKRKKKYRQRLEAEVLRQTKELVEKNRINEALLSEVHHRVKNNLQKISSLIYLNLDFITHKKQRDVLLEIDLRINTMALIHEMLYSKSDFENIPIKEYLQELQTSIDNTLNGGRRDINYVYDIQADTLSISNSATIGMFTNEALTNAIKYAFKNTAQPEIKISLIKHPRHYIFSIKDNGCGIASEKKNRENSFGMKLFDIFARQIGAELSIISENGTELSLKIPEKSLI